MVGEGGGGGGGAAAIIIMQLLNPYNVISYLLSALGQVRAICPVPTLMAAL